MDGVSVAATFSKRWLVWLGAVLPAGLPMLGQQIQEPKEITVCELLRDSARYNGKTISVRGEYFVGDNGLYLRGLNCGRGLITKGYTWPALIWLSDSAAEFARRGLDAKQFVNSVIQIGKARSGRAGSGVGNERVTLTYTGLFETRKNLADFVRNLPDGSVTGDGFGPVPGAPGQLFVQAVDEIVVELEPAAAPRQR